MVSTLRSPNSAQTRDTIRIDFFSSLQTLFFCLDLRYESASTSSLPCYFQSYKVRDSSKCAWVNTILIHSYIHHIILITQHCIKLWWCYCAAKEIIPSTPLGDSKLPEPEGAKERREGVKCEFRNKQSLLSLKLEAADPKPVRRRSPSLMWGLHLRRDSHFHLLMEVMVTFVTYTRSPFPWHGPGCPSTGVLQHPAPLQHWHGNGAACTSSYAWTTLKPFVDISFFQKISELLTNFHWLSIKTFIWCRQV